MGVCKKARFPSWENLLKTASTRQMTENCIPSKMTGLNAYILLSKVKVDILYQKVIFYVILVIIVKLCLRLKIDYCGFGPFSSNLH